MLLWRRILVADPGLLILNGVSAYYGRVHALEDIDLGIGHGESVAILGANGAGKTSLLRAVSGILVRRVGRIVFDGTEIGGLPPHDIVRLGISHVPEGKHLFPPLTVAENLEIGALPLYTGGRKEEVAEARHLVFELFPPLTERRKQLAGTLSGGEQQMLAIARTIMSRPKLLLLDEPSVGLAPKVIEHLFKVLKTLKQLGLTILLAEQNVPLALDHANKAIVLNLGRIALSGSAAELHGNPEIRRIYLGGD
jgi:branched-chain amino acid transport system ATP-binding protein